MAVNGGGSVDPRRSVGATVSLLGEYAIRTTLDAHVARRGVRGHALQLGFGRIHAEELTIVASELCTNIVKYGIRGSLVVERLDHPLCGPGMVLEARDEGPAFRDFERAIRDRSDDRGTIPPEKIYRRPGIGAGLGAVLRLSHQLWMEPLSRGKRVIVVRYLTPPPPARHPSLPSRKEDT